MLIEGLLKTWGELAPNELASGPDEMNLVIFVINCLNKRGWSWNLAYDSEVRFIATVENGPETTYPTALEALLSAYLTALAVRRPITQGTRWRHYKGGLMEVAETAAWAGTDLRQEYIKRLPEYTSCGNFVLEASCYWLNLVKIAGGTCLYLAHRDYGEGVFYRHDGRNWARPICDFLGLTQDGQLRFVEDSYENP
jgi:hypothetical protein